MNGDAFENAFRRAKPQPHLKRRTMALRLPFTYYRCSCVDAAPSLATRSSQKFARLENEEQTFDPKSPRANYSLFPLEHLLYCTECHQVRCSRCILEEIVCWYCPSCLFEVPSSTVRTEGNRYEIQMVSDHKITNAQDRKS